MNSFKYPSECKTSLDKLEYAYIAQEQLRLQYNSKGVDFKSGKILKEEWDSYVNNHFMPKMNMLASATLEQRDILKKSTRFTVDLDNLLEKS